MVLSSREEQEQGEFFHPIHSHMEYLVGLLGI